MIVVHEAVSNGRVPVFRVNVEFCPGDPTGDFSLELYFNPSEWAEEAPVELAQILAPVVDECVEEARAFPPDQFQAAIGPCVIRGVALRLAEMTQAGRLFRSINGHWRWGMVS